MGETETNTAVFEAPQIRQQEPAKVNCDPQACWPIPDAESVHSLSAEDGLGMIRAILFGEQVAELKRKQDSLEQTIHASIQSLSDTVHDQLNHLSTEISQFNEKLLHEIKQRESGGQLLQGHLDKHGQLLHELGEKLSAGDHELATLISDESEQLNQRIAELRQYLLEQVSEKADRKMMAAILNGMARELFDGEGDPS
ncbi:MAG: hypothetical protein CR991_09005 [Proteobacteria bacterium]|nr:MAG: hypothetical protein CR991_09005 [Pseudomonadota bacterium]